MIPIERFEAGQEYEVQVQAIDLWDAHSPMSETYSFKVSEQFIAGPTVTAPRKAVALTYNVPMPLCKPPSGTGTAERFSVRKETV